MSFDSTFSEIDFELTNLTAHYATPLPVTIENSYAKQEKPVIDKDGTKNSDTSKELLQIYTKELDNLCSERSNASEKIKELEKDTFLMKI